jgi:polyhydroxybutyrate depolymerase
VNRFAFCCLVILTNVSGIAAEPMHLTVDGQARTFLLERPTGQGPHPTIFMLHGGGDGGAEQEVQLSGLAQLGPREGFVAVFPQATGGLWNFFPPGKETVQYLRHFQRFGGLPDDVAFLKMLVADLVQDGITDPKRVYLAGRSLGGVMVLRLACVDAGSFAAIGLLISAMPGTTGADCHPSKPVPVLMINGTDDRVLPYRGLPYEGERSVPSDILWPTQRLVAFFSQLNGCAEPDQQSVLPGQQAHDIVIERSTRCLGGPVILYRIVGGGHEVPAKLNASLTLLDFFRDKMR